MSENTTPATRQASHETLFSGSEVPVQFLFDHLAAGGSLDSFGAEFPIVKREQAVSFLELTRSLWNMGGPGAYVPDPGPELLSIYQCMCRKFTVADYEKRLLQDIDDAAKSDLTLAKILLEIEETLARATTSNGVGQAR